MAGTFDINIDCGESFGNWVMGWHVRRHGWLDLQTVLSVGG